MAQKNSIVSGISSSPLIRRDPDCNRLSLSVLFLRHVRQDLDLRVKLPHQGTMIVEFSASKSSTSRRTRAEVRYEVRVHCEGHSPNVLDCRTVSNTCALSTYPAISSISLCWLESKGELGRSRRRPGLSQSPQLLKCFSYLSLQQ